MTQEENNEAEALADEAPLEIKPSEESAEEEEPSAREAGAVPEEPPAEGPGILGLEDELDSGGPVLLDMVGDDDSDSEDPDDKDSGSESEGGEHGSLKFKDIAFGEELKVPPDVAEDQEARDEEPPAPEPAKPPAEPSGEEDFLRLQLDGIYKKLDLLERDFEGKLKYDAHKEAIIDKLHQELQDYKGDLVKKNLLSVFMDLIKVMDDVRKLAAHYRDKEPELADIPKLINALDGVPQDMEDSFELQGVFSFSHKEGDSFDPQRQRVIQKIETEDDKLDKAVARSIAPGYEWDDKVIRKEMVAVYYCKPPESEDSAPEGAQRPETE